MTDTLTSPEDRLEAAHRSIAYLIPEEKFVLRQGKAWDASLLVGKDGALHHLLALGIPVEDATKLMKSRLYTYTYGMDLAPGEPPIFTRAGRPYLNTWVPPTLVAEPGEYPTIERVLEWLTKGDVGAQDWLTSWLAAKVQTPDFVPKTAVVLSTVPGAGKGMLNVVMETMLGPENCARISRKEMENKFNARWIRKLWVLADECVDNDNLKNISEHLKILIDGSEVEWEAKGSNQRSVRNRLAWLFASNDSISPVNVERGDRRYTVLTNQDPVPADYKAEMDACFEADRVTPTPAFRAQIAAFYHDLLEYEVDRAVIARPYGNASRDLLIEASLPSHVAFFNVVDAGGLEALLEEAVHRDFQLQRARGEWDFGERGVAMQALYRAYAVFCSQTGQRPMKQNRLGVAIQNRAQPWPHVRLSTPSGARPMCYVVPRRPTAVAPAAAESPAAQAA